MVMRLPLEAEQEAPAKAAELTKRLRDALRTRYAWPEWALLEEISLSWSPFAPQRVADGIAIGMWAGSHFHLHGFEIKATRADWLREMRDIGKADDAYRHCHRWWLVAPEGVADPSEIPGTWGWMTPRGSTLRVKCQASVLTPEPLTHREVAHLLAKAISKGLRGPAELDDRLRAEYERGLADGKKSETHRWSGDALEQLRASVDRFEVASGVKIDRWSGHELGEAVKFITAGGLDRQKAHLEHAASYAYQALAALSLVVPKIRKRKTYLAPEDIDLRALVAEAGEATDAG